MKNIIVPKIDTAISIVKSYKNWFEVLNNIRNRKVSKCIFRDGLIIQNVKDPSALAQLKSHDYYFTSVIDNMVLVSKDNLKIWCRLDAGFDFGHILEIYENKAYLYDVKDKVVLDVGASNGDSAIFFARNGAKLVIALEPMPESFQLAKKNITLNELEGKIVLINAALDKVTGRAKFQMSTNNPNTDSIKPIETILADPKINFDSTIEVQTYSLVDIMSRYRLEQIDLLKMDCEGCEYEVLQNLPENILRKIRNITLEYHDGLKFLPGLLKSAGFDCKYGNQEGLGILSAQLEK